jgi:hypothetical protein
MVNSMVIEHFNATVSADGLYLKLQAKVPKAFIDIMARAYTKFDATYANTLVIQSTLCSTVEPFVFKVGPDFDKLREPQHQQGHQASDDANPQDYCRSPGKAAEGAVHINDIVLHWRSSYQCGDSGPPPPPGHPSFSSQPRQSGGSGYGFPNFAMGGCNTPTPTTKEQHKYYMSAFAFCSGGKTDNKEVNYNNNTRKGKSPRAAGKNGAEGRRCEHGFTKGRCRGSHPPGVVY